MKITFKRLFSFVLVLALIGSMLPAAFAQEEKAAEPTVFTEEDYAPIDAIFDQIDAMEDAPARKNATEAQLSQAAEAIVVASDGYVEGSLERNGNSFTWWTDSGVRCVYSPRMREIEDNMIAPEDPTPDGIYNEPTATKGGWPSGNQVYLIGPYYGHDSDFTDQYKNEAKDIASAIGDTDGYTLYSGTACTVDKVAEAVSKGAVVIFDSHGNTDYESGYDYVTGATSSYLCLTSTSGLTDADYDDGALYYRDGIWINGATISNHMTTNSPSGILWMAICLGMATDTFSTPLRERGVEVVYGYSQSVSFDGDYCFEEVFWDNLCAGKTVAEAVSAMKSKYGNWDGSPQIGDAYNWDYYGWATYSTISAARADYAAFPIVVSDEDSHPGQRKGNSFYGADSLQTVKSTYTLFSQYEVAAKSNNTSYGTVSVSGSTITANPKTGYFAQSATVLSGTATVSQDGNIFTVHAECDCTVQINFAPKTAVTVSFSGANISSKTGYAGDPMTLPTVTAPEGYTFLGWMGSPLSAETTQKPSCFDSFTPTASTTLYALYSYVEEGSGTGSGDYVKVTSTPADWSGEYVIVYEDDGYIFDGSLKSLDETSNYQAVTISNHTISAAQGDPYKFTIAEYSGGYSIQGISGGYIGQSSNANGLTTSSSALKNSITLDSKGNANITGSGGAYLRYNANSDQCRFRYYKTSSYASQKPIALYLKDGSAGTTWYTGNPTKCEHASTTQVAAVAATCTEGGYTAGVYCNGCESYISGHEPVDALGHDWSDWAQVTAPTCTEAGSESCSCSACGAEKTQSIAATGHSHEAVVTPPTATEQGYTTYTCPCGDSYVADYTEALGEIYTVSFRVPTGVTAVEAMECGKNGITLPTAGIPTGDTAYTFAGWSAQAIEDTETEPTLYKAGQTYKTTANTTLYAVYSYVEAGAGSGDYVKVTAAPADWSGEYVIVYEDGGVIFDGSLTTFDATDNYQVVSITNNTISAAEAEAYKFTIAPYSTGYAIQGASGKYIGHSANANKITTSDTEQLNKLSFNSDGSVNIICQGGAYLRFNSASDQNRFRYYKSSSYSNQKAVALYVKDGSTGTTYYTSLKTAEPVAAVGSVTYTDINEAIGSCAAGQYVKLLADAEAAVILEQDLYIDLNGFDLTGLLEVDGHAVYGMDSTTDSYSDNSVGVFSCLNVNDQPVVPQRHIKTNVTGAVKRYLAVQEKGGYTFHRFYLGITHATVKPGSNGVGYKASFCGDDTVKTQLASYGYSLQLDSFQPRSVTKSAESFESNKAVTLRIENYDVEHYGEADLTASVTMTFKDGTVIESTPYTTSLRQIVAAINANTAAYTAEQLAALKEMIQNNPTMASWEVGNI